jgi:AhpD family alkylhydroperoxidase
MARVQPAAIRGLDPIRRLVYASARRMYGRPLEPTEVVAHHRPLLVGYAAVSLVQQRFSKTVPNQLKELAMLRAAQLIGCEWCLDFGSRLARDSGIPEQKLRELSLWHGSGSFDEDERLVLEYSEAMTRTPVEVSDRLFERLRARFDEPQIVELTMSIALENLYSRSNWAFGIESEGFSEGSYCVRPQSDANSFAEVSGAR